MAKSSAHQKKQYQLYRAVCLVCIQMGCLFGQEHILPSKVRRGEEYIQTAAWHGQEVGHFITLPTFAHNPFSRSAKAVSAEAKQRPSLFTDTQEVSFLNTLSSQVTLPVQTRKIKDKIWMAFCTIRCKAKVFHKEHFIFPGKPKNPCQSQGLATTQASDLSLACTWGEF